MRLTVCEGRCVCVVVVMLYSWIDSLVVGREKITQ